MGTTTPIKNPERMVEDLRRINPEYMKSWDKLRELQTQKKRGPVYWFKWIREVGRCARAIRKGTKCPGK